jgi:serine/threonine protein kinase
MEDTEQKNKDELINSNEKENNSTNKIISFIIIIFFILSIALVIIAIIIYFAKDKSLSELEVYKKYQKQGNISVGGDSIVYKVKNKETNQTFALKEIKLENNTIKNNVENDIKFMKACYNLSKISIQLIDEFEERSTKFLVTELYDEDLSISLDKSEKGFDVGKIKSIIKELNKILYELREVKVAYNNIKLESILVKNENKNEFEIRLSDYSKAKLLTKNETFEKEWNIKPYSGDNKTISEFEKQDLFDIGKEIYRMLFKENDKTVKEMIPKIESDVEDTDLKNLLIGLLDEDFEKRIDWNDYFNHTFFVNDNN